MSKKNFFGRLGSAAIALVMIMSFITVDSSPVSAVDTPIEIPGAIQTEEEWAAVSTLLDRYSDVTRRTTVLTSNVETNRLTAAMYTGNGMLNLMQGGRPTASARTNVISGVAGCTTSGMSYWIGHNDCWGDNGAGQTGVVSYGGVELKAKTAASNASSVYSMRQNIKESQLECTFGARNTSSANAVISVNAWTPDGANAYDTDNSMIVYEISNNSSAPVDMDVAIWVGERLPSSSGSDCINAFPYLSAIDDNGQLLCVERQVNRLSNNVATTSNYTARVATVAGIRGASFSNSANAKGTASADFSIPANGTVQLVLYTRSSNGGTATSARIGYMREAIKTMAANRDAALQEYKDNVRPLDISALKATHLQYWKNYWLNGFVLIPYSGTGATGVNDQDVVMRHWYGAMYCTGCTQRGNMPHAASMWGNLLSQDDEGWGGRWFLNYNQQAQYYGAPTANKVDSILPLARGIDADDNASRDHTHQYGYEGLAHQRTSTPFNMYQNQPSVRAKASSKNLASVSTGSRDQKSNTPFSILPQMWYYEYTLDDSILLGNYSQGGLMNNSLYKGVYDRLEFYMDIFVKFYNDTPWPFPSSSYNTAYTDQADKWNLDPGDYIYMLAGSSVHESDYNDLSPGLDIGGAEKMVRFLLEVAEVAGTPPAKVAQWQDFLDHLCPYPQRTYPRDPAPATAVTGGNDVGFSRSHSPAIPTAIQNRWGNAVTVICAAYAITPYTSNITNNHTFVIEPYDQLVELEPVFPFESRTILDDPAMRQRAIDTADYMQSWHTTGTKGYDAVTNRGVLHGSFGSTTNSFCKTFPICAHVGYPARDLLAYFKASQALGSPGSNNGFRTSNLLSAQSGGGLETVGASEMLNAMLLTSDLYYDNGHVGKIDVFPNWTGQDAQFTRFLAKGAFEVTSKMSGGEVEYIGINSKKGATCAVKSPWGGISIVDSQGAAVSATWIDGYYTFATTEGESYLVLSDGTRPVTGITLSPASLTLIKGTTDSAVVNAVPSPIGADPTKILWSCSDTAVATVVADPLDYTKCTVTAVAGGFATVTAVTEDGRVQKTMEVSVFDPSAPVESVTLNETEVTLTIPNSFTLTAEVLPAYLVDRGVDWASSDANIVTIDANGVLTPKYPGTATITATSKSGEGINKKSATCAVTVVKGTPAVWSIENPAPIVSTYLSINSDLPAELKCSVFDGITTDEVVLPVAWDSSTLDNNSRTAQTVYGVVGIGTDFENAANPKATVSVTFDLPSFEAGIENGAYVGTVRNTTNHPVSGMVLIAAYNKSGKLVDIESGGYQNLAMGGTYSLVSRINRNDYPEASYDIKVFFWDEDFIPQSNFMVPLEGTRHWIQLSAPAGVTVTNWRLSGTTVPADGSIVVDYHTGFVWVDDGREGTYTFQGLNGSTVTYTTQYTFQNMKSSPRLSLNGNGLGAAFGSTSGGSYPPTNAFDGSGSTFYEHNSATAYVGWDFGAGNAKVINVLKFQPRGGVNSTRAYKGKLQGSNTSTSSGFVDLFEWDASVSSINTSNPCIWYVRPIDTKGVAYRYYRWYGVVDSQVNGGPNSRANISNIALYFDQ